MSAHVHCNWDGKSDPTDYDVDAIATVLAQNYAYLKPVWTLPAFAIIFSPADSLMHTAAYLLDICGGKPKDSDLEAAVVRAPGGRYAMYRNSLKRVFKRLEELLDECSCAL